MLSADAILLSDNILREGILGWGRRFLSCEIGPSSVRRLSTFRHLTSYHGLMLPEAIIFDLDDTILDDSGSVDSCWNEVCTAAVDNLDGIAPERLLAAIEQQRNWFWSDPERHREGRLDLRAATRRIVEQALLALGCEQPELARDIADGYRDLREERLCLVPGAIETLDQLQSEGICLGMITNGSAAAQRTKIVRFGLAPYFERIVIEGEFGLGKPHRQVYEAVLGTLGAEPAETWSVGDNLEWDVSAPQALGMFGIWVDVAGEGLPNGTPVKPDRTVRSIAEL